MTVDDSPLQRNSELVSWATPVESTVCLTTSITFVLAGQFFMHCHCKTAKNKKKYRKEKRSSEFAV